MDIERTTDCMFDRLIIYDGRNKKSPILATLCGGGHNMALNATGNYYSLLTSMFIIGVTVVCILAITIHVFILR